MDGRFKRRLCAHECQLPQLMISKETINVVLGVLREDNRIFLVWRDAPSRHSNCWELPGGKVEANESPPAALQRELHEELGLAVIVGQPVITMTHHEHDLSLRFRVYEVRRRYSGGRLAVNRPTQWCRREDLHHQKLPPANGAMVHAVQLPHTYAIISAGDNDSADDFITRLQCADRLGGRLFLMRAPQRTADQQRAFIRACRSASIDCRRSLLVHNRPAWVEEEDLAGVHVGQAVMTTLERRPVAADRWFAVSCHSLEEVQRAEHLGADFCVLGPLAATPSHPPTSPLLGLDGFCSIISAVNIPVFAIGGMNLQAVSKVRGCGGQGIAGIRCFERPAAAA